MRRRATRKQKRKRIKTVQSWILDEEDNPDFEEAVGRIRSKWRLGRRQAIRYWVEARVELMTPEQRRAWSLRPMTTRKGRFQSRPCGPNAEPVTQASYFGWPSTD